MISVISTYIQDGGSGNDADFLDRQLDEIAKGSRDALAVLYQAVSKNIYSFALSILKNTYDAQDVLQDCFLHIYSSADTYRSKGKPMAWLLTITKNLCLKCIRSRERNVNPSDEEWNAFPDEHSGISPDDRLILGMCMNMLTDEERQIVVLHAVTGLKHREIAALLDVPLATVLSKYNRALKKLKRALEKGDNTDEKK